MAKLTTGQRAHRVLTLLMALSNPRILGALVERGFEEEDADEGWRLLRKLAKLRFGAAPASKAEDPNLLEKLDQWENTWFPVADATLSRRFPKVHQVLFLNLSQTEGPAVIVSVGTFLERVTALRDGDEQERRAAKLLVRRGLTDAVLANGRALLAELGRPAETPTLNLDAVRAERRAADAELWSWYLEWSQLARTVITDRRSLRELGFLRGSRAVTAEPDETDDEDR